MGLVPEGWLLHPTGAEGCRGGSATVQPHGGKRAAYLESKASQSETRELYLFQSLPGDGFAGRRVRLRAALRWEGRPRTGTAGLWMKAELADDAEEVRELSPPRRVLSDEWELAELLFDVPPNARRLVVSLKLDGYGTAWVDDVTLDVLGPAGLDHEGPRALEGRALANLVAFTRLLGYVRHFHPSDEAFATDWDAFAIRSVRAIESASSPQELARTLEALFHPVAPSVQVFASGDAPAPHPGLQLPEDVRSPRVLAWRHEGFGQRGGALYESKRRRRLARSGEMPDDMPDPRQPLERVIGGGVTCRVSLALFADREGTLPRAVPAMTAPRPVLATGDDRATRLAAISLAWNVFQHFFPYFDVVETDWPAALEEALRSAATDADHVAFLRTIQRFLAHLDDGHAWVQYARAPERFALPILWDWIDDKLIVTLVDPALKGPRPYPGDEVRAIAGRPAVEVIAEEERFVSAASERPRRRQALKRLLYADQGECTVLSIESPEGDRRDVALEHGLRRVLTERRPPRVHEFEPDVFYVDIDRIDAEDLTTNLDRLDAARGVVFDLRGYPDGLPMFIASLLSDEVMKSPRWLVPKVTRPDRERLTWDESSWPLQPSGARLAARVAFVTDSSAQSAAETYLSFIEQYRLADIVGEPTAGTNGNVNPFYVPGDYLLSWTGMRVLKQDGSRHHGIGILPTVPVSRTRAGVIAGRDELLVKAIEVVTDPGATAWQRGDYWLRFSEPRKAISEYTHALEDEPNSVYVLYQRAQAYLMVGELEPALADHDRAVLIAPEDIGTRQGRGFLRWALGDVPGAFEDFESGVDEHPDNPWPYKNRAQLLYAEQRWAEALRDVAKVVELNGALREDHLLRWLARTRMGEREAADAELRPLLPERAVQFTDEVGRFLVGDIDESTLFEIVARDYADPGGLSRCLAHFYAGSKRLVDGDDVNALVHLRKCLDPGLQYLREYWTAKAEIGRLER